jgi:hypothetical protein
MSQQACAEFFTKIQSNASLQQEFLKAIECEGVMAEATAYAKLGAKYGYEFTAQQAVEKYQEIIATAEGGLGIADEEELDEEALKMVAGGSLILGMLLTNQNNALAVTGVSVNGTYL